MKILPSAVPRWERELGLECENSTINLITRAVAPAPVSGSFLVGLWSLPILESQEAGFCWLLDTDPLSQDLGDKQADRLRFEASLGGLHSETVSRGWKTVSTCLS